MFNTCHLLWLPGSFCGSLKKIQGLMSFGIQERFTMVCSYCLLYIIFGKSLGYYIQRISKWDSRIYLDDYPLVLFPLVLLNPGEIIKNKLNILLKTFASGTFLFMFFCFGFALYRSFHFQDGSLNFNPHVPEYPWLSYFYGSDLVISQHPSYIAMYALLSSFICFEAWFDYSLKFRIRIRWLIIAILLLISQYFLSSRAGILISMILIPIYFLRKFKSLQKHRFAWIGIIVIIIFLLPVIIKNQRVGYLYDLLFKKDIDYENQEGTRLLIWESAIEISKKNLLFGVGIGDVRTELANEYKRIGQVKMADERLNAHNQFVEVLLENGIIGVAIFIAIFMLMSYIAFCDKNLLFGIFIFMIFMFFMFETVLYRLAGVTFFSLFSFLLLHVPQNKNIR